MTEAATQFKVKFMAPVGQIWQGPCNRPEALIEIEMVVFPALFDPVHGREFTSWRKDFVNARREKMTPEERRAFNRKDFLSETKIHLEIPGPTGGEYDPGVQSLARYMDPANGTEWMPFKQRVFHEALAELSNQGFNV